MSVEDDLWVSRVADPSTNDPGFLSEFGCVCDSLRTGFESFLWNGSGFGSRSEIRSWSGKRPGTTVSAFLDVGECAIRVAEEREEGKTVPGVTRGMSLGFRGLPRGTSSVPLGPEGAEGPEVGTEGLEGFGV